MGTYFDVLTRWNCSAIFLLPTLGIPISVLGRMGLINTFLDDVNHDAIDAEDKLYLLFNNTDTVAFSDFLAEWKKKIEILDDYDYENGWIVVVVKLNDKWKEDYSKFYQGHYSRMSSEFKALFPQKGVIEVDGKRMDDVTIQWKIFKKDETIKKEWREEYGLTIHTNDELWQSPQMDKEVLTEKYLEQLTKKENGNQK